MEQLCKCLEVLLRAAKAERQEDGPLAKERVRGRWIVSHQFDVLQRRRRSRVPPEV